jgi:Protein of unknown function (DUF2695)
LIDSAEVVALIGSAEVVALIGSAEVVRPRCHDLGMEPNQSQGHVVRTWNGQAYRLPIDRDQYRSLLTFVEEMLAMQGCDNTLSHAETWARAHKVGWAKLGRALRSLGGFCDCEIGMNTVSDAPDEDDYGG